MIRSIVALACVAAALVLAPSAQAAEPLTLTGFSPAFAVAIPPTPTGGIPWQVTVAGPPPGAEVSVTVSSAPTTGPDGTLPSAGRLDFFFLSEDPVTPGTFNGRSDPGPNAWSADLGNYYWQAVATWTDAAGVFHSAASAVERLLIGTRPPVVTPPPTTGGQSPSGARTTLAMSSLDATFYVRAVIRQRTKRAPAGLRYGCKRLTSRSFRCRPRWRDSRNSYTATATFTHTRIGGRIVARGTSTGRRASRQCTRTRSARSCGVRFRWRTVTAVRPIRAAR
jgi:hypothetical protein